MRRVRAGVAAVGVAMLLAGCAPGPSPSPSPTGFADEDAAFAAAEATYRAYVDALNRVDLSDPATFEDVYKWTTGELNASDRKNFTAWHAEGYSIRGDAKVLTVSRLRSSDQSLIFRACYDVSDVDVFDASGNSLVSDSRPKVQSLAVTAQSHASSEATMRISAINPVTDGVLCSAN